MELFDLEADVGETRDRSKLEPALTEAMRRQLREWRRSVTAQENTPNPSVDMNLHRQLYIDFDPTRFDPPKAGEAVWNAVAIWRQRMNAAVKPAAK